jgi:hypothetical protein
MTKMGVLSVALCLGWSSVDYAQDRPHVTLFGTTKPATYQLHEGSEDKPHSSAGICFQTEGESNSRCYEARDNEDWYFESPDVKFFSFPVGTTTQVAIFSAKQNFGGSGTATLLTALVIDSSSSTIRNILPKIVLSRQGDFKVWFDRSVSSFPLFSTAEFMIVPDSAIEGEHRYKVQTFSFDRQSGVYRLIDAYITRKAYNVFGSPTPFSVLSKEQSILKARVDKAAHPHGH